VFAKADDVKIAAPPAVIAEIVDTFSEVAWHEAGLSTQVIIKNRIYVQPAARDEWCHFLDSTPRDHLAVLPIHDIPDGSFLSDPSDPISARQWQEADEINILGTPLGSPDFIESYLFGKGIKQRQLLNFIQEVASAGFPREVVAMLTGAAGPCLTHLLESMEKNPTTAPLMREMESANVATWLHCLTSSSILESSMDPTSMDILTDWLDLPPSYGGASLNSLFRSADEELLGSFADIAASLISFCRKTELLVYIGIAEAVESMGDVAKLLEEVVPPSPECPCESLEAIRAISVRVAERSSLPTERELTLATQLIRGHSIVEVPGKWNRLGDAASAPIVLPETRTLLDFVTAPCKQEVSLMRRTRQARQASNLY
jgi:hypothetical protein